MESFKSFGWSPVLVNSHIIMLQISQFSAGDIVINNILVAMVSIRGWQVGAIFTHYMLGLAAKHNMFNW